MVTIPPVTVLPDSGGLTQYFSLVLRKSAESLQVKVADIQADLGT